MNRPLKTEYNPYFQHYIDLVVGDDFWKNFNTNTTETESYFLKIPAEKHLYKYAPGKWTIKEILMHIIDTERVFAYRALVCGRGDTATPLHSMDENLYASNVDVSTIAMKDLVEEFSTVRRGSVFLFKNLTEEQTQFKINGVERPFTARALGFIMIGHIKHHINVINDRYL